ncbi:FtsK/SpoIIIE domain-containing protein [Pedococcus sp. P5_B7]
MRLQLTVLLSAAGGEPPTAPAEVEVEAAPGATAAQLASALVCALSDADGAAEPTLSVAGTVVEAAAEVGRAPLVDGAAVTLAPGPAPLQLPSPMDPRTPVTAAITHGPDAGRTLELPPGVHTLGRGSEATIVIDDARISRVHAVITVDADSITVADTGSTNGTELDGAPVGAVPHPARIGATIRVGDTLVALRAGGGVPAAVAARDDGTMGVNRRPRLLGAPTAPSISLPAPPVAPHANRVPWLPMLLPFPIAGVMALLFGPMMLAFAVMSPVLIAGNVIGDRLTTKRRYAAEHAAYLRRHREAEERVQAACRAEADLLSRAFPDPAQTLVAATTPTVQVWQRRRTDPDALTASVGWCNQPASVRVLSGMGADTPEAPLLQWVPCAIPLAELGVTGICGERTAVMGVLRALLGQLVTLHSPRDLELVLVTGPGRADPSWSWLGRLPHVRTADGHPRPECLLAFEHPHDALADAARAGVAPLAAVVRQRVAQRDGLAEAWSGARTLVVLDGAAAQAALPDLAVVLEHGPSVGICVLAVADERPRLPSECRAVLDLDLPTPVLHVPGSAPTRLVVDRVGPWWADRLSRGLAPLRDATPATAAGSPPAGLGLRELLGLHDTESMPATIARTWSRGPESTSVPIGHTGEAAFRVDLASDGPHVLVAGTTGAGKSELLRTLVASLVVQHRPEHLSLVLVDYKGGAAFRECSPLPHVAAVVTDLDEHLAARALTSLRAELKRREQLLADAEVADFLSYQSSSASVSSPLPRLVVVIDEFRALAEELPQFIDGMVAVAALGRSLGIHLVLATQRPAGVVTADIRTNMNLRIGLRLRDRSDSVDVIDAPDAAALDPGAPGRALARVADGPITAFQTAFAGARSVVTQGPPDRIRVRRLPWGAAPAPWPESTTPHTDTSTDLSAVVAAVSAAVAQTGARRAASPWLAPLPERIEAQSLPRPEDAMRLPIGLVDEPAHQRQRPLEVALDEPGHWGFVGGPGSGRTTALLAVVGSATRTHGPSDLHVYAVSGGSLSAVQSLPHCGAHVSIDDLPRLTRLVAGLSEDLADRRERLATTGRPSMAHWRRADPKTAPAPVVLLVDDWDLLAQRADDHDGGQVVTKLLGLLREGAGLGLTGALAGDRALLVGRAAAALAHRVLLRMNDPTDLLLAGLSPRSVPTEQPPGRGLLLDGTEVQIAVPPRCAPPRGPTGTSVNGAVDSAQRRPWRVDALPTRVSTRSLPQPTDADDVILVGIGGDVLAPRGLSPSRDPRRWAVIGGSGSGVSTTLATVASGLATKGRQLCVVATPSAPWAVLRGNSRILWCDDPGRVEGLVALRRRAPDLVVVVDDADQLLDTPLDAAVREIAASVDRDGGLVVVGAKADAVSVQYRGLAVSVAKHRTGILLGPSSATAADLLGTRVPVDRLAPPGRGYLVRSGAALPIQVASTSVRR